MIRIITTISCLFFLQSLCAQSSKMLDAFPHLPFDIDLVTEFGYDGVSVWFECYEKMEGDTTGETWSKEHASSSYQSETYLLKNSRMHQKTAYLPSGDKIASWEYFYKEGLLVAIDEAHYDSLQEKTLKFSQVYAYDRRGFPFQRVMNFYEEGNFRLLTDYLYDEEQRLVREKSKAVGRATKLETATHIGTLDNQMTLVEYDADAIIRRTYANMYDLQETYSVILGEEKAPVYATLENGNQEMIWKATFTTEGQRVVREEYRSGKKGDTNVVKAVYYKYNFEGLIETVMIEEDGLQKIYSYSYFID